MYFSIGGVLFAIIFHNILYYFAQAVGMDERKELAIESAENDAGVAWAKERKHGKNTTVLSFRAEDTFGAKGAERSAGEYHTILIEGNILEISALSEEVSSCVAALLAGKIGGRKRVLAVGLGNPAMVVDALGSETVRALPVGDGLCVLIPSVYGVTGLESATIVRAVAKEVRPDLVLAVDTLATRRAERLSKAVQISDVGIAPGGGVGNKRESLCFDTLGVPVVSVGVPLLAHAECLRGIPAGTVVTPKEIDLYVPAFSKAIGRGIERALSEKRR